VRSGSATLLWLILCSFPFWIGCNGCRTQDEDPAADAGPASEYTFGGAQPLPQGFSIAQSGIKPGHWFTLAESIRSNRNDQRGTLRHSIEMVHSGPGDELLDLSPGGAVGQRAGTERLPLLCERPAVLPKGRTKRFDSRLLAGSPKSIRRGARAFISGQYSSSSHAALLETGRQSVVLMQPQEYFFVILTRRPERFSWIQTADWVRPPLDDSDFHVDIPINYRLVFPNPDGLLALPDTLFDWTSTAVLLWDDLEPAALTPEQGRAISDWVRFGGRLIVNGPGAGVELSRSRFGELMPLDVQGSAELDPAAIEELLVRWSVSGDTTVEQQVAMVSDRSGRLLADGQVHPSAVAIAGTSEMLLTRQAGRGHVVLTRFDLTSDWMRGWRSRDSFFNAALLGRPGRNYVTREGAVSQQYVVGPSAAESTTSARADVAFNSSFRLLSRDARLAGTASSEFVSHPSQGMGGWRDDSDAANLILETLRTESGVTIPPRKFVTGSLAVYLLILSPLNYLIFRLLGRLEWAWLAVPLIGLIGAAWIAQGAGLDVGFARSRTEIALVELHSDYPRGHVTRFMSLYNSLSRQYDLAFDSPDAVAAPLGILGQTAVDADHRQPVTMRYGYADGPVLAGVQVASNRTRIFHAEQVIDFGGTITLKDDWLHNGSSLDLLDAWIIRKDEQGKVNAAPLGVCDAGARKRVRWSDRQSSEVPGSLPLQAERLLTPLGRGETLPPGATRLVARCEAAMPGLTVTPETAQHNYAAVVVVHLKHPQATMGRGDHNLLPDRLEKQRATLQEDEILD
jgi:hypothetical protein